MNGPLIAGFSVRCDSNCGGVNNTVKTLCFASDRIFFCAIADCRNTKRHKNAKKCGGSILRFQRCPFHHGLPVRKAATRRRGSFPVATTFTGARLALARKHRLCRAHPGRFIFLYFRAHALNWWTSPFRVPRPAFGVPSIPFAGCSNSGFRAK